MKEIILPVHTNEGKIRSQLNGQREDMAQVGAGKQNQILNEQKGSDTPGEPCRAIRAGG